MSDLATTIEGRPPAAALLDKKMKKSHAMISGGVVVAALVIGLGFIGFHIFQDFNGVTIGSISRADTAHSLLAHLEDPTSYGKTITYCY